MSAKPNDSKTEDRAGGTPALEVLRQGKAAESWTDPVVAESSLRTLIPMLRAAKRAHDLAAQYALRPVVKQLLAVRNHHH